MILRETEPHRKQHSKRVSPRRQPAHRCSAAASPILAEAFGVPPAPAKHERRGFFLFFSYVLKKLYARSINKGGASLPGFLPPSPCVFLPFCASLSPRPVYFPSVRTCSHARRAESGADVVRDEQPDCGILPPPPTPTIPSSAREDEPPLRPDVLGGTIMNIQGAG